MDGQLNLLHRVVYGTFILIAILCAGAVISGKPSNRPPPNLLENIRPNQESYKSSQQAATENHRRADNEPLAIKLIPGDKTEAETRKEKYETEEKPALDRGLTSYTGWLTIFTALLFCAASIQAALFIWQLLLIRDSLVDARAASVAAMDSATAARESAEISKLSLVAGNRAYLHYAGARYLSHLDPQIQKYHWSIRPQIINKGNTPSRKTTTFSKIELLDEPLTDEFSFHRVMPAQIPSSSIAADSIIESGHHNISGEDLLAIKERRKFLYMWGVVEYYDIFPGNVKHITKYCVFADRVNGEPRSGWDAQNNPLEIAFASYHRHNCTDEDCES